MLTNLFTCILFCTFADMSHSEMFPDAGGRELIGLPLASILFPILDVWFKAISPLLSLSLLLRNVDCGIKLPKIL